MRVPLEWLQQYVEVEASVEEVATRLTMGGLEVEGIEASELGPVLDVYITPNRGDCLSMVGVAREVAALYDLPLRIPMPTASTPGGDVAAQTSVTIEDADLCPRYAARLVRGVTIGPSPDWMQARLEAAGQRPINNVVDVTNYVMLELGQPLHAFDLNKLVGQRIVVRRARPGEQLATLDGVERTLTTEMLVIADAKYAVAVGGVMGGAQSEVSESTTDLLLEAAHFDPLSVRRTSRALGLRTEASYRFERVVDPSGVHRALDRACQLLSEMGVTGVVPGVVDVYPAPVLPVPLVFRSDRASELLGFAITASVAAECLGRLSFGVRPGADEHTLEIHVPTYRADVRLEEDLIEEVGRIYGYENIPETLPIGVTTRGGDSEEGLLLTRIRQLLVGSGLQEVITHSLTAPSFFDPPEQVERQTRAMRVPVRNALSSEVSGLRRSLLPNLIDVALSNAARSQNALALFEIGRVWRYDEGAPVETISVAGLLCGPLAPPSWQVGGKAEPADFATMRGVVEQLCAGLHISSMVFEPYPQFLADYRASRIVLPERNPFHAEIMALFDAFHPGRTAVFQLADGTDFGIVGELHPRLAADLGLRDRILLFEIQLATLRAAMPTAGLRYRPLSPFPAVARDVAPRVPISLPYAEVEAAVRAADVALMAEFRLLDVYTGPPLPEGMKSLTLSFTFRAADHTLKESEINSALDRLRTSLVKRCRAEFAG